MTTKTVRRPMGEDPRGSRPRQGMRRATTLGQLPLSHCPHQRVPSTRTTPRRQTTRTPPPPQLRSLRHHPSREPEQRETGTPAALPFYCLEGLPTPSTMARRAGGTPNPNPPVAPRSRDRLLHFSCHLAASPTPSRAADPPSGRHRKWSLKSPSTLRCGTPHSAALSPGRCRPRWMPTV